MWKEVEVKWHSCIHSRWRDGWISKDIFYKQTKHCTHRQKIMKVLLQSMYHVTECQERSYNTIPVPCLIPFSWGKAISGAPSIKGTNQSPKPIIIGITKKKIMTIVGSHHFLNLVIHPTRHKGSFPPCGSIPRKRQPVLALLMLHPMSHQGLKPYSSSSGLAGLWQVQCLSSSLFLPAGIWHCKTSPSLHSLFLLHLRLLVGLGYHWKTATNSLESYPTSTFFRDEIVHQMVISVSSVQSSNLSIRRWQ